MTDAVKIIDISHWQGFPDFAKVRVQGVIAAIMKITDGTSFHDPNCARNTLNATKNGIKCCTYHWLKPRKFASATAQMKYYLDVLDPVPGERMVIDYEEAGVTLTDLIEAVTVLKKDPRQLQITVYSGNVLKEQLGTARNQFLAENTDLWLAQYTTGLPAWPAGTYPHWKLWQYSESGRMDGIVGSAVDLNRFDGTDEELLAWISPKVLPAELSVPSVGELPSEPSPSPATPIVEITLPAGVGVRVNGVLWKPAL